MVQIDNIESPIARETRKVNAYVHLSRTNWWRVSNYINEEAGHNLRNYRYVGGDVGYAYGACYSPLASWCVEWIPEWVAPNVVSNQ